MSNRYRIDHKRINTVLTILYGIDIEYFHTIKEDRKYYINFYDYLLSQRESYILGDLYIYRKYKDYRMCKNILEREENFSNKYIKKVFSFFLKDITLINLKFLSKEEGVIELIPTLPKFITKDVNIENFSKNNINEYKNRKISIFGNNINQEEVDSILGNFENFIIDNLELDKERIKIDVGKIVNIHKGENDCDRKKEILTKSKLYSILSREKIVAMIDER